MKDLMKKNRLMITALAVMIAIAGYLQFSGTEPKEEYFTVEDGDGIEAVDSPGVITENYSAEEIGGTNEKDLLDGITDLTGDIPSLDGEVEVILEDYLEDGADLTFEEIQAMGATPEEGEIPGEAVYTSSSGVEILADAKLLKEQTRAKNKETLLEVINSTSLGDEEKQNAISTIVDMTKVAEMEAAAEILLEAKGFSDVVVSVNGDSVDVVVNALELSDAQRAQIEDIVMRKTEVAPENIIISTVVQ